jgi:hypothetical protein
VSVEWITNGRSIEWLINYIHHSIRRGEGEENKSILVSDVAQGSRPEQVGGLLEVADGGRKEGESVF